MSVPDGKLLAAVLALEAALAEDVNRLGYQPVTEIKVHWRFYEVPGKWAPRLVIHTKPVDR